MKGQCCTHSQDMRKVLFLDFSRKRCSSISILEEMVVHQCCDCLVHLFSVVGKEVFKSLYKLWLGKRRNIRMYS